MENILSSEELETIKSAISSSRKKRKENEPKKEMARETPTTSYELTGQAQTIQSSFPTLDLINDHLARAFVDELMKLFRLGTEVQAKMTSVKKYREFTGSFTIPSCYNLLQLETLYGNAMLVIDPNFLYNFFYLIWEGKLPDFIGQNPYAVKEEFTPVERRLIKRLVGSFLRAMEASWKKILNLRVVHKRTETMPQAIAIVEANELVVCTSFDIGMDKKLGTFDLAVPYSCLEPHKKILSSGNLKADSESDKVWIDQLRDKMRSVHLELSVELGQKEITVRDFIDLQVGDIVRLEQDPDASLAIKVEGVTKLKGRATVQKGNLAVKIETPCRDFPFLDRNRQENG
jgi:flagellar motor switch protein FliM